ncbi:MAG: hypothetical protein Q9219_001966 [cf. Caloplaca sp. 3 TL-2023]
MPSLRQALAFLPPLALSVAAQAGPEAFEIFKSTGRLPDRCLDGYTAGHDEVLYNVPYTYDQVLSIIGSFANITWNGINETRLNGTDNTVGTARFYQTYGIDLVETIKVYNSPAGGPYFEDHTLAPAYNPTADLSIYSPVDITTVTPICDGTASALNFTIDFCSTNVTGAGQILHDSHVFDATLLQEFLGNDTWTGCTAGTAPNATATTSSIPSGTGTGVISTGTGSSGSPGGNGTSVGGGGAGPTAPPTAFTGGATVTAVSFGAVVMGVFAVLL